MPKKGYKQTKEHRRKLIESHRGVVNKGCFKKGNISWNTGLTKESDERVRKASESNIGKHKHTMGKSNGFYGKKHTEETKEKNRLKHLGIPHSKEHKIKIKEARAKLIIPTKDTSIEVKIQNFLKELKIEFFTHQYMKEIEHGYQCDILIPSMNLVIECDGNYWHKYPIGRKIDNIRTKELIEKGFKVLRLWEFEIKDMELNDFKSKLNKKS